MHHRARETRRDGWTYEETISHLPKVCCARIQIDFGVQFVRARQSVEYPTVGFRTREELIVDHIGVFELEIVGGILESLTLDSRDVEHVRAADDTLQRGRLENENASLEGGLLD